LKNHVAQSRQCKEALKEYAPDNKTNTDLSGNFFTSSNDATLDFSSEGNVGGFGSDGMHIDWVSKDSTEIRNSSKEVLQSLSSTFTNIPFPGAGKDMSYLLLVLLWPAQQSSDLTRHAKLKDILAF